MEIRIKQLFLLSALMAGFSLIPADRVTAQTFMNLYSFTAAAYDSSIKADTNSDGADPLAGLVLSGNTLYGTTASGSTNGNGTVFAVHTDGMGFTNLHTFTALSAPSYQGGTNSDGAIPYAGLILSEHTLYGTTYGGGTHGNGTVFAVNTDGTGFTNLHSFTTLSAPFSGTNSDGAEPYAGLILSGSTLYGTAYSGGTNGNGTVFALNINGSNFTTLYTFTAYINYTNSDGASPVAGLILSDNTLYGTAGGGGTGANGTVFAVNIDGTGFTNLYSFTAYPSSGDGANPDAGLVLSGSTLYGTTHSGGTYGDGTVFAVTINGTVFTNLHSFTGGGDGANPYAGLIVSGNTLFGTAGNGGKLFAGTLFAVTTNGMGFTTVHTFTNHPDGDSPHAGLILSGNTLYGTTGGGGTNGYGLVFSLSLPTPQLTITYSGTNAMVTWPTNVLEFILQSTTNLVPPTVWTTVSPPPYAVIGTNNVVTNTISGTNQFYRLSL
jgi:uncharacterized repeat protein (TIGR03803 family)